MYKKLPNLVLGFHGCNHDTYKKVLFNGEALKKSENSYDWLGHGIYFWEQNFIRAQDWARQRYGEENAYVIGAVIDLGYCLNLTDSFASHYLSRGYELLKIRCDAAGIPLPSNRPSKKRLTCCCEIWIAQSFSKSTIITVKQRMLQSLTPCAESFLRVSRHMRDQNSGKKHTFNYVYEILIA